MRIKKRVFLVIYTILLAMMMSSCKIIPDETADVSLTTHTEESAPTEGPQVSPSLNQPRLPEGPAFDADWSRPLEVIAGKENVIIVGNGNIHEIDGIIKDSQPDYYPNLGSGLGRFVADELSTCQHSLDHSKVGVLILEDPFKHEEWPQRHEDIGKLILYDGTDETVVAQDVLSFSLSADGQMVAYLTQNKYQANGDNLFVYNVKTAKSTHLSDCAGPSYVSSVMGQAIVYTEYDDAASSELWRVILKVEGEDKQELTPNMFPIAVSDDGSYAYALEKDGEETYKLWVLQNGSAKEIGDNISYSSSSPIFLNQDCSQVIFNMGDGIYFSQDGKAGWRLMLSEARMFCSLAFFHTQYGHEGGYFIYKPETRYLFTNSLFNVVYRNANQWVDPNERFWLFNDSFEIVYLCEEDIVNLYSGQNEYWTQVERLLETETYVYRLHETTYQREGEPDIKYYLDTEYDGPYSVGQYFSCIDFDKKEEIRQNYIDSHYFDLYMLEEPFDGTPIKVAENVSQVWSDAYGIYYICLEEIAPGLREYFSDPCKYDFSSDNHNNPTIFGYDLFDTNGLYYSKDGKTFEKTAYTKQLYMIRFG